MYVHYVHAHKDEWVTTATVPDTVREVELYQVHKSWVFNLVTSVRRNHYENWSTHMLSLTGNDAGPDVIDAVKVRFPRFIPRNQNKLFYFFLYWSQLTNFN